VSAPPRYCPERDLPPYAYLPHADPGARHPHPVRDPGGHSRAADGDGGPAPGAGTAPPDPAAWRDSVDFRYGVDLFNHGYFWEAHEAWEDIWRAAGDGPAGTLLHGLIKLAAAGVKTGVGNPRGTARHAQDAAQLFAPLAAEGYTRLFGLDPRALKRAADAWAAAPEAGPPTLRPE
jgi:hypothetical protein